MLEYKLSINRDYYIVTRCDKNAVSVEIPVEYNGLPVKEIGENAFSGCVNLVEITIPNTIKNIGDNAFYNCSSLTTVVLPNSVISIGSEAFDECSSLTSVTIGSGVTSIGDLAFYYCSSLTEVTIPDSVEVLGNSAFCYCSKLTSITIGNNITGIGEDAFDNCSSLTKVNYTGTIDQWAQISFGNSYANPLHYANNLYINDALVTEANINTATFISGYAFFKCSSLVNVSIGDSVINIGDLAFSDCTSLTSVTIGNNVISIGEDAFWECCSLTSVIIPDSVTSIGDCAFYGCSSLTSITLPFAGGSLNGTSNTHFGYIFGATNYSDNSIYVPDALKTVVIGGDVGSYAFQNCSSLTSVTMDDNVASIGQSAFNNCKSLTSISIPPSVKSIGENAFSDCDLDEVDFVNYVGWQVEIPKEGKDPKIKKINKKLLMDKVKAAGVLTEYSHVKWINTVDFSKMKKF